MSVTGLVYHPDYIKHDTGLSHPERPERVSRTIQHLGEAGLLDNPKIALFEPSPATVEDLKLVHATQYIEKVKQISSRGGMLTPDTPLCPETYEIARLSAGGALLAGELTVAGEARNSFALIRPPGHHAGRDYGGGFCCFNNIAIMIEHLRNSFRMRRFMIIDLDVHHGNGTQDIFYSDPTVLYFSTHQMPLYPGTGYMEEIGEGEGKGYNVNLPLPAGTTGEDYNTILTELVIPLAEAFRPEMIGVSSGFDAYFADPIANLEFTVHTYISVTGELMNLADRVCKGRLALVLEGGYDLEALPNIIGGVISTLARSAGYKISESFSLPRQRKSQEVGERIRKLKTILNDYWNI